MYPPEAEERTLLHSPRFRPESLSRQPRQSPRRPLSSLRSCLSAPGLSCSRQLRSSPDPPSHFSARTNNSPGQFPGISQERTSDSSAYLYFQSSPAWNNPWCRPVPFWHTLLLLPHRLCRKLQRKSPFPFAGTSGYFLMSLPPPQKAPKFCRSSVFLKSLCRTETLPPHICALLFFCWKIPSRPPVPLFLMYSACIPAVLFHILLYRRGREIQWIFCRFLPYGLSGKRPFPAGTPSRPEELLITKKYRLIFYGSAGRNMLWGRHSFPSGRKVNI